MEQPPTALAEFGHLAQSLGWVSDLWVAGSLATGDYLPGVSDFDLVALSDGPPRSAELAAVHARIDPALNLGCVYVDAAHLTEPEALHPTWTHGVLVQRILSGVARAELVRYGYAVFGRAPVEVLPPMSDDDLRAAARDELTGYWAWAARRPSMFLNPIMVDLGLTGMARGRHTLRTGELLTKSAAIEQAAAPSWLIEQVRGRRRGQAVSSPRVRAGLAAWRDVRRTTLMAKRWRRTDGSPNGRR